MAEVAVVTRSFQRGARFNKFDWQRFEHGLKQPLSKILESRHVTTVVVVTCGGGDDGRFAEEVVGGKRRRPPRSRSFSTPMSCLAACRQSYAMTGD